MVLGCGGVTVVLVAKLINSSYGRAMKAIREDEIAARAMGMDPYRHLLWRSWSAHFFPALPEACWLI